MTRQAKNPPPEPLWHYAYASRPALWALSVWGGTVALWGLGVQARWLILATVVIAALAPAIAAGLAEPLRGRWFQFALWAAIGTYVTVFAAGTPFSRDAFLAAVPGAAGLGSWWWWVRAQATKDAANGANKQAAAKQAAERGLYVEMLERVLKKKPHTSGLIEIARDPFPAGASYGSTIRIGLPRDGSIPYSRLESTVEQLETAANARVGSLLFERDNQRGAEALLHVMERNALTESIPLPFDRGPKSINDAFDLGRYADGEVTVLTFREVAAMLVGLKGSGKSSLINTVLAHLTGCVDALVWMIDLKGGGETVRPWIEQALRDGGRPGVDWAAVTADEADAVLAAVNAAIAGRRGPLKPTRDKPAIVLIVEEASLVTGVGKGQNATRAGMLQDVVSTGRSVACDALICSQRATVTMIGNGDMVSNLDVRIGMGVTDRTEASYVMPDGAWSATLARIPKDKDHRGSFLMQDTDNPRMMPSKAYWVDPALVPGMASTNASYQPDLDVETLRFVEAALSQAGVSGGYAGRWERARKALGHLSHPPVSQPGGETPGQVSQEASQGAAGETAPGVSRGASMVQDAIAAGRVERDREKFDRLMAAEFGETANGTAGETPAVPEFGDSVPPVLRLMLAVFAGRGNPEALPTRLLCQELPGDLNATALGRLMGHCNVSPVENVVWDGKRARGYTRDAIETAIKRGSFSRPAFDWQP